MQGAWNAMEQTFKFNPIGTRRVAWIESASVIARVMPAPGGANATKMIEAKDGSRMVASAALCARLADLRRLARRYSAIGRMKAHRPLSSSLPLAG